MKKFFTLITILCAMTATAQTDDTFTFTDLDGNALPDGTVITVSTVNAEGQMVVPVKVRNTSGEQAAVGLYETIDGMPNGSWQTCAFGNCMNLYESGYSPKKVAEGDFFAGIETEWIPDEGAYASWTAKLQIHLFNIDTKTVFGQVQQLPGAFVIGQGPTLTINFNYADPAAISTASAGAAQPVAAYSLSGQRLAKGARGLCIVRTADGKTMKKINK